MLSTGGSTNGVASGFTVAVEASPNVWNGVGGSPPDTVAVGDSVCITVVAPGVGAALTPQAVKTSAGTAIRRALNFLNPVRRVVWVSNPVGSKEVPFFSARTLLTASCVVIGPFDIPNSPAVGFGIFNVLYS
jgi:hypothetical protein